MNLQKKNENEIDVRIVIFLKFPHGNEGYYG